MRIVQGKESWAVIMSTVNKLADLVRPTFGPAGNKVIIGKGIYSSALDDGVQIAKDLELEDDAENYVLKLIREVAVRTNDRVGDGTTSSLIILQALMQEIDKGKVDGRKITEELKQGLSEAVEQLSTQAKQIKTKADLEKVARISFDNADVAKLLAEIVYKIGADGLIDVEASPGFNIEAEMTPGFKIANGFLSPYFVTDKEECILDNPYILISDSVFSNNAQLLPILEAVHSKGRALCILSKNVEGEALQTLIVNKMQGKIKSLCVNIFDTHEDIALLTGAKALTMEKGASEITLDDLGTARKIIARKNETVIIGGKGNKADIRLKASELQEKMDTAKDNLTREQTRYRLGRLTNNVAVIKVGANTENEAKALCFKVEDASNAVKAAYKSGVVKGAGTALAMVDTSSPILNSALKYPRKQLEENMGPVEITPDIIDPVAVLIAGLESAVSIACLLSTTKGIIVETKPE